MNRKWIVRYALAAAVVSVTILVIGYFKGNSAIIHLLGGDEIDVVLMEERINGNQENIDSTAKAPKNYLPPLPKYSYLGEEDELQLNNMSLDNADTGLVDALLLNQQPLRDSMSIRK